MHRCDVPSCVNPEHLFLGAQVDNMRDMIHKGRRASFKGELHGRAKLDDSAVVLIRASNKSTRELADQFGVHLRTVRDVLQYKTWRHVKS